HEPSPMTAAPPGLDDGQIERLSDLLDRRAVPFRGFNLEALDGFLSALAVSPEDIPADEWRPVVWGGKEPRWGSEAERREVHGLLDAHLAMGAARARLEGDDLPEHLAPLVWLSDDPELHRDGPLAEDALDVRHGRA